MKKLLPYAAVSAGLIMALGLGSLAAAAEESEPTPTPSTTTEAPLIPDDGGLADDESGDESGENAPDDGSVSAGGLVCEFVPAAESEDAEEVTGEDVPVEEEAPEPATPTIEEYLATGDIQCTGTGNERSASVALVPRFLAKSELWSGREKGAAISEWAKTHANKESPEADGDGFDTGEDTGEDTDEDLTTETDAAKAGKSGKSGTAAHPVSPGKSGEAKSAHKGK